MTIQEARQQLIIGLSTRYDNREATAITDLVLENLTGWKKIALILNKQEPFPVSRIDLFNQYTRELLRHRPVQYVLGEAWFFGMKFHVDENVLIPRPETEELVDWILKETRNKEEGKTETAPKTSSPVEAGNLRILDIGTGSGCIPIALKKHLPDCAMYSCDISVAATGIARQNAITNETSIQILNLDFLDRKQWKLLPDFHILVSNPPYIPLAEKPSLGLHITEYEPRNALFVPDDNPLIFYEAIADFAKEKLIGEGSIFVEVHEAFSSHVKKLFSFKGLSDIELRKDIHGKDRLIKATLLL